MDALERRIETTAELATENRKRHTNTDSSLGFLCNLVDRLYDDETTQYDCCFEEHTDSQVGNFMLCLTRQQAALVGYGNVGVGVCATTCSGLAPDSA